MSWMIIYLDRLSPDGSSDLPGSRRAALCSLFGLASSGVYMCPLCYQRGGSLLHCLSTLTCENAGGLFLLHCPWSHLRQTLSGTLPFEARTFLSCTLSAMQQRSSVLLRTTLTITQFLFYVQRVLYLQTTSTNKFSNNRILRNHFAVHSKEIIQEFQ